MINARDEATLGELAKTLACADRALFITGAGVSVASGLPTYRGVGGLYNDEDAAEGLPIETLLSGQMFSRRPELTWRYLRQIEEACRGAKPNRAHAVIAELQSRMHVVVLTQNVDGLHHAAGSREVIDIHGDFAALMCTACDHRERVEDYTGLDEVPRCPSCSALIRPDVVLFGEMLPTAKIERLETELTLGFDVVFSVGTTSVFPYIAAPIYEARRTGTPSVEINPGTTSVSRAVSHRVTAPAELALDRLVALAF